MKKRHKILMSVLAMLVLLFLLVIIGWSKWRQYLIAVDSQARPPVNAVLWAYYFSKVMGGYWEDEIEKQVAMLAKATQGDRVAFFRGILLNCDLDGESALTFVETLGGDDDALLTNLLVLRDSPAAQNLTKEQCRRLNLWLDELPHIIKQHR